MTSGLESRAELGVECIRKMIEQSHGRLSVMPGAEKKQQMLLGLLTAQA